MALNLPATLNIAILDRHIEAGHRGSTAFCPIALATREELESRHLSHLADSVSVSKAGIYFNGSKYELPTPAKKFIEVFDADEPVAPMTVTATLNTAFSS